MRYSLHIPRNQQSQPEDQAGFTIIELMIATLVFSVILLVITVGVISFTSAYYRGINSSATQVAAQNATDAVSQAVQFSIGGTAGSGTAPAGMGVFCAGTNLFLYQNAVQYAGTKPTSTASSNVGLFMVANPGSTCNGTVLTAAMFTGGTELLSKGMRVINPALTVASSPVGQGQVWSFGLKVVYGDDDLLCSPTVGNCSNNTVLTATQLQNTDIRCKSQIGSQFCSVATLSTIIQQRLVP